jgi:MFS family permease
MAFNLAPKKTDFLLIFLARILRMFSYGMLAIVMIKNLQLKNFTGQQIGIIQFAVILGDIVVSLILTTKADLFGRKKTLMLGALLKLFTGFFYAYSSNIYVLVITGIIGVISVTGTEIGPFLPIEQSTITQII